MNSQSSPAPGGATLHPITLSAMAAIKARCQRIGASPQLARTALIAAARAMEEGASPARAYAVACITLRTTRHGVHDPRGAA